MTNRIGGDAARAEVKPLSASHDDVLILPTTLAQQRILAYCRQKGSSTAYNLAVRFRLRGPLDVPALRRAFNQLVQRHETLRTVFNHVGGQPVQMVLSAITIDVPVVDLRGLSAADRMNESERRTSEEAHRSFDLTAGPLIRATLLWLEDQEHVLLVTVHQSTCDCWSTGLISHELGPLYEAATQGRESPLPELSIQYGDYAIWQKEWLEEVDLSDQLGYWTRRLANLPRLEIATDHPRPKIQTSNGHIESVVLPKDLTETLKTLSHQEACTFFMLSLAALKVLIQHYTCLDDIYVGTVTAGRTRVDFEPLIGRFINPLIVRTDLSGDPPFLGLLARVRDSVLESLDHRDIPYERVLDALKPTPDPSRNPLFQINFVHQRAFLRPVEVAGISLTPIPSKSAGTIYDLYFFMVERAEGWRFSCEYNTDLYNPATIQQMLVQYQSILEGIAANPLQRLSTLRDAVGRANSTPETVEKPRGASVTSVEKPHVAPQNETEERLAHLWLQVLKVKSISTTADFFDEGGHSVLAARLLTAIEERFGKKLSFATLLRAPTIRALAARLRQEDATSRREQVHEIQPEGEYTPFFVVTSQPPLYRPLSRRLGLEQPLLGLTVPELRALPNPFTIGDVATNLMEALCEVQPHGPYYIGGWCVSGVIVYEMAQQLRQRGEEVALLAIFDAQCPPYSHRLQAIRSHYPARFYFMGEKLLHWIRKSWRVGPREACRLFRSKIRLGRNVDVATADDFARLVELLQAAVMAYEPKPYDSPVVLFRSRVLQSGRYRDTQLGWGDFASDNLEVVETPGEHGDMFREPAVQILADKLSEYLPPNAGLRKRGLEEKALVAG
jgi:thioesterase domain-containing protein/acyl carrier protein